MQLRALEKAPKQHFQVFDPTDCPDVGVMDQMSLAELRQRLVLTKQRLQAEVRGAAWSECRKVQQQSGTTVRHWMTHMHLPPPAMHLLAHVQYNAGNPVAGVTLMNYPF